MIQIDMPMPDNCLDCIACNEYLMCAIPVNGRKWGENDVLEYGQSRPEWCPMKMQEAVEPIYIENSYTHLPVSYCPKCREPINQYITGNPYRKTKYCHYCGQALKWG